MPSAPTFFACCASCTTTSVPLWLGPASTGTSPLAASTTISYARMRSASENLWNSPDMIETMTPCAPFSMFQRTSLRRLSSSNAPLSSQGVLSAG